MTGSEKEILWLRGGKVTGLWQHGNRKSGQWCGLCNMMEVASVQIQYIF
jgi:hypothetical protein